MKYKLLLFLLLIPQLASAYYCCVPCCSRFQACGWWGSADYLFFWRKPRFYPPLVTTNPTLPPILTTPGTTILFGNKRIGGAPRSGGRGDFGVWFTQDAACGVTFYVIREEKVHYELSGSNMGLPIFGQPFFNTATGMEAVNSLSLPGSNVNGEIEIDTNNRLWGLDLYLRSHLLCSQCFSFDLLGGFQYTSLNDNLNVNTHTTTVLLQTTKVYDHFGCENNYYAGLVGFVSEWRSCNWGVMVTGKLGLGNMQKVIKIKGRTTTTVGGVVTGFANSGLLAQPSNIGTHKRTKFVGAPQINVNLRFKINPHIWLTLGYAYLFWSSVALAGEQVNLNINPLQTAVPPVGMPSPFFHENLTNYWVQGITGGLYFCY
jgi:hypothetical protein